MTPYLEALNTVLMYGAKQDDRTGTGTISYFGMQQRYDVSKSFPLVTTKRLHLKSIIHELLWFLSGDTNIKYLKDNGVSIWDEWADENGDLGPVYGKQWRQFPKVSTDENLGIHVESVDQIANLVEAIKRNPDSRRHVVSAWNPAEVDDMALPPCHTMWQVAIINGRMDLQLYQRSADMFLGVPFNIASYALLLKMLAHVTGHKPGFFIHTLGHAHIYLNHLDQVNEQLSRLPKSQPNVEITRDVGSIFDFKFEDFKVTDYDPHPAIKAPVAV